MTMLSAFVPNQDKRDHCNYLTMTRELVGQLSIRKLEEIFTHDSCLYRSTFGCTRVGCQDIKEKHYTYFLVHILQRSKEKKKKTQHQQKKKKRFY